MNLENLDATLEIREAELNFTIKTTRASESRVQRVRTIGGHEDLNISTGVETIKLIDDLKHSALYFGVSIAETSTTNGINLIEEDDARLFGSSELENLSDHASTFTNITLNEL